STIAATIVFDIGSLDGDSGVGVSGARPPIGTLITIEKDPRHARIAREAFASAGLSHNVQLIEGAALDVLPTLSPGFDAVFIDADKEPLPQYFAWGMRLPRPRGLLAFDYAFLHGPAVDP